MIRKIVLYITILCNINIALSQQYKGSIYGTVIDAKTQECLPSVNIQVVELNAVGTVTDIKGNFTIKDLPVGTYSLKVSLIGYISVVQTNVVVSTGRSTKVVIKLNEQAVQLQDITVTAEYFSRNKDISPVSINSYDRAEVKRLPGSMLDVQRAVQNMPGVGSSNDNINELIVRGGAPHENLTILENMEIPTINHYPNQFNSSGPINMINIDLVEDVQFSSGGFPVKYGDKLSSFMDINIREGDREKLFATNLSLNMAGVGALMEGRLADGKGSWIFSARQSLLEIIDKMMGMSTLSLTAVPKYWDTQTKIVYDISSSHKIIFNGLLGKSRIMIKGNPLEKDESHAYRNCNIYMNDINMNSEQYVAGLSLKSIFGKSGYSMVTLYANGNVYNMDMTAKTYEVLYGEKGNVLHSEQIYSQDKFVNKSTESFIALKYDLHYKLSTKHDFSLGAQIQTSNKWKNYVKLIGDTMIYDILHDGNWTPPIPSTTGVFTNELKFGDANKVYAYVNDKYALSNDCILTFGLRYDYFDFSKQGQFSPRASIAYDISNSTTLSFASGIYWQTQPFPYYSDINHLWHNKHLPNAKAIHYVLGMESIFDDGIKLSIETYLKNFSNMVVSEQFIYSPTDTMRSDKNLAIGKRLSYGIELFLQKKQVTNYYGTLSLSLTKTEDFDVRIPKQKEKYDSKYDYPIIASLVVGKIVKGVRSWLDSQPFFIKYSSYILPLSDEMEISLHYRYQTGGIYTPKIQSYYARKRLAGGDWSDYAWVESKNINSERYPDYSRLDIQYISRFYMESWNINVYFALHNVLNKKNVFYYEYHSNGQKEPVYQFTFFPVAGFEIEF